MKKTLILVLIAGLLGACAKKEESKDSDATTSSEVSDAVEGQVTSVNNATGDIGTTGVTISRLSPAEQRFLGEETVLQKTTDFAEHLFDSSLKAVACANGGDVTDTGANFGGAAAFSVTRTLTGCIRDGGAFKRDGVVYLGWSNLSTTTPYVQATPSSVMKRAVSSLKLTRVATGNLVEVKGNDATNAVNATNANHVLTWTAVTGTTRTLTMAINETRTGTTAAGVTRFRHNITTPTALTIAVDTTAQTRTIASGSVAVEHAIKAYTVTTTFTNAVWDLTTCQPKSGSATIAVTGSKTGSGTVTFASGGKTSYTYNGTTGEITLQGC